MFRHKRCVSNITEFSKTSTFHRVLEDDAYSKINNLLELKKRDNQIKKLLCAQAKFIMISLRQEKSIEMIQ